MIIKVKLINAHSMSVIMYTIILVLDENDQMKRSRVVAGLCLTSALELE